MNEEREQKMLKYIDALEGVNEQLVIALKECMRLLSAYPPVGAKPVDCKKMLNDFEGVAGLSNNLAEKKQGLLH
jgi:hypothetical protein